jgi:hypothetical protein
MAETARLISIKLVHSFVAIGVTATGHCRAAEEPPISKEVAMRMIRFMILAGATILAAAPATAQRYDPRYPVCLQKWEWGGSAVIDCSYTSWAQCQMTASGLSAMCLANPYWPQAHPASPDRLHRRQGRV